MKKIITLFMVCVLACCTLAGCGTDPVQKELEQFANEDMKQVNKDYRQFTQDYIKVSAIKDTKGQVTFINGTLIKNLDSIIKRVDKIKLESKEVKDLRTKYLKVVKGYKAGLEDCVVAMNKLDNKGLIAANNKIKAVSKDLDNYNNSLKKLAKKYDLKVLDAK